MDNGDGKGEQWLEDFTTALRQELPAGQYLLTHAREYLQIVSSLSEATNLA